MKEWIWSGRPWKAFKNFAIIFSFMMNMMLLIALVIGALLVIPSVSQIAVPIVGGLNQSFVDMSQAHIVRTIQVEDEIPIAFSMPVSTETLATITQPVPMAVDTSFVLPAGGGTINGTVFFELPAGTQLPIQIDLVVPVSKTVPVSLAVEVDIPIEETEMNQPFKDLQAIFTPLHRFLYNLPASNEELFDRIRDGVRADYYDAAEQASNR